MKKCFINVEKIQRFVKKSQKCEKFKKNVLKMLKNSKICKMQKTSKIRSFFNPIINFQISSRRSVGSYGDANSIASEEMSQFIADVTTKIPSDLASSDSEDDGAANEGDAETETEAVAERKSSKKFAKKSAKNSSNANLNGQRHVDDENDSGLQLSDN